MISHTIVHRPRTSYRDFIPLPLDEAATLYLPHGLVASDANFLDIELPTDLRLPDSGRNEEMMLLSCHLHIIFIWLVPNTGTRLVLLNVFGGDAWGRDRTTPDHYECLGCGPRLRRVEG